MVDAGLARKIAARCLPSANRNTKPSFTGGYAGPQYLPTLHRSTINSVLGSWKLESTIPSSSHIRLLSSIVNGSTLREVHGEPATIRQLPRAWESAGDDLCLHVP